MSLEFASSGSSTLVLPDHFYAGSFEYFEDTFPLQTQFLLCSDGLYGAFSEWPQLHAWLRNNAKALHKERQDRILGQLHSLLNSQKGDDDISFVWVYPRELAANWKEADYVS